jgi:hypothetical protein
MATKVKAIKLCKRDETLLASLDFNRDSTETTSVENRFGGASADLSPREVALYKYILECEESSLWTKMQIGLTLFRKLNSDAYYTLLD